MHLHDKARLFGALWLGARLFEVARGFCCFAEIAFLAIFL